MTRSSLVISAVLGVSLAACETNAMMHAEVDAMSRSPDAPFLRAGVNLPMPIDSHGTLIHDQQHAGENRHALVFREYLPDEDDRIHSYNVVIPLEPPRNAYTYDAEVVQPETFDYANVDHDSLRQARSTLYRQATASQHGGRSTWWVLAPIWNPEGQSELEPYRLEAECYREQPGPHSLPVEMYRVAERARDGTWKGIPCFDMAADGYVHIDLVREGQTPVAIRLSTVDVPSVEELLGVAGQNMEWKEQWINKALIASKNRNLPSLLREGASAGLRQLAERIEIYVLDTTHQAAKAKDEAQRCIEQNSPNAGRWRGIAASLQERVEIVKSILAAVRDELATRSR